MLFILAGLAAGRWLHQNWTGPLPALPVIALDRADPEVAEAIAHARAAVEQAPRSAQAWATLAMLLDAHQFVDEAATCYTAAGMLDRTEPSWPYLQGTLLFQSGSNAEQALPCLERAARLAPGDWALPGLRLADLFLELGRTDDADRAFQQVLALHPKNSYAQFGLGRVLMVRQQYQESLRYLHAVAGDSYVRKRACALRAAVYERLGDKDKAAQEQRRFAALPEDEPLPDIVVQVHQLRRGLKGRILRAQTFVQQGETAKAVALMKETVDKYPQSDQAWVALGVANEYAQDFASAQQAMEKGIQLAPDRADHRFHLGKLLEGQQRYKEAAAAFRKANELRPVDADTYLKLGECLQALGDNAGAADAFRNALRYNPELKAARQRLGKLSGAGR